MRLDEAGGDSHNGIPPQTIHCLECRGPATIEPSRQYISERMRPNPTWRIVNCPRCGRTQYPSNTQVQVVEAAVAPVDQPELVTTVKGGRRGR